MAKSKSKKTNCSKECIIKRLSELGFRIVQKVSPPPPKKEVNDETVYYPDGSDKGFKLNK